MRAIAWLTFFAFVLLLILGPLFYFDHAEQVEQREWRDFSAQHHCRVTHAPSTWRDAAQNTWTCDGGFQVLR